MLLEYNIEQVIYLVPPDLDWVGDNLTSINPGFEIGRAFHGKTGLPGIYIYIYIFFF